MKEVFKWDALKRKDYFVDYQNLYTFCGVMPQRNLFLNAARELEKVGEKEKAVEMLDMCMECVPEETYPLDISYLGFSNERLIVRMVDAYLSLGENGKATGLAERFTDKVLESVNFYIQFYDFAKNEFEDCCSLLYYLSDTLDNYGLEENAKTIEQRLTDLVKLYSE